MALEKFQSTYEELAAELIENLKNGENAIVLIMGTETPEGIRMRRFVHNPGKISGILTTQAISMAEFEEVNQTIFELRKIAAVAEQMIEKYLADKSAKN